MYPGDNIITAMEDDLAEINVRKVKLFSQVWHDVFGYYPVVQETTTDTAGEIDTFRVEGIWWSIDDYLNLHFHKTRGSMLRPSHVARPADLRLILESYHATT